ncbi:MAG: hypothetical protein ACRDAM_08670 [Casimicrobium sp.]
MSDVIKKIIQWQLDIGSKIEPDSDMAAKHIGFVLEECVEAFNAIDREDWHPVTESATNYKKHGSRGITYTSEQFGALADAFGDMVVFGIAGLMRCGYDPVKTLEAIQESNDSKRLEDGSFLRNEHGKIVKPSHYEAPDLSGAKVDR